MLSGGPPLSVRDADLDTLGVAAAATATESLCEFSYWVAQGRSARPSYANSSNTAMTLWRWYGPMLLQRRLPDLVHTQFRATFQFRRPGSQCYPLWMASSMRPRLSMMTRRPPIGVCSIASCRS